jgi:hypothetical protein
MQGNPWLLKKRMAYCEPEIDIDNKTKAQYPLTIRTLKAYLRLNVGILLIRRLNMLGGIFYARVLEVRFDSLRLLLQKA